MYHEGGGIERDGQRRECLGAYRRSNGSASPTNLTFSRERKAKQSLSTAPTTPPNQHKDPLLDTQTPRPALSASRKPAKPSPRAQTTTDNAYSRVRDVQGGQAYSPPYLRRRRLRRQQGAQGRAGFHNQRAVGAEHDGAIGAGGAGQVLLQRGRQPPGEVRTPQR